MLGIYQLTSCLASLCVATLCSLIRLWYSCASDFHLGGIFVQHEYDLSDYRVVQLLWLHLHRSSQVGGIPLTSGGDSCGTSLGGSMVVVVEGTLTHPCHSFAVGKPAMVLVRVQGAHHSFLDGFDTGMTDMRVGLLVCI
jgi:hypothetical protein